EGFVTYASPDPALVDPIVLPARGELLRDGAQASAQLERYERASIDNSLGVYKHNLESRLALMRLGAVAEAVDLEFIRRNYDPAYGVRSFGRSTEGSSEQRVLNLKALKELNLLGMQQLTDTQITRIYIGSKSRIKPGAPRWGLRMRYDSNLRFGGLASSEFEHRRAFGAFMDDIAPVLVDWAKQMPFAPQCVAVGKTAWPQYQFDLNGYVFDLVSLLGGVGTSYKPTQTAMRELHAQYPFSGTGGGRRRGRRGVLVTVDADKAESLSGEVSGTVFSVYRAQVQANWNGSQFVMSQTVASDEIALFADEALTKPLLRVPLAT
ncbi:MAG: hypothetical protein AAFX85_05175, partial [Pseudomonadota bacterium]